ncbi:MAG: class I SAM-dependent methyltransferase [Bacteroidota bacterium]|nr:class I SAM-dependent methyltransferase [Bacteroidota bacterium]
MGCGAGRMLRHLHHLSQLCEIWGTDINSPQVTWAKKYLSPPFHLATTTTIPHLPFEDRYFNFIYCGSVFTHIEDLAEAWLCELKRVLSPGGRLYITIHDNYTIELLQSKYKDHWFAKQLSRDIFFNESKEDFEVLVLGRDALSNVFYNREYFTRLMQATGFKIFSITQEAYAYQTAVLVEKT